MYEASEAEFDYAGGKNPVLEDGECQRLVIDERTDYSSRKESKHLKVGKPS